MKRHPTKSRTQDTAAGNKKNKLPLKVSSLFGKILPDNYAAKTALIQQYQEFFLMQDSDAVFQLVRVLNVDNACLTLSVPSPALINYLRLHSEQISRQIEHQFGRSMALKIVAAPAGAQQTLPRSQLKPAPHFSQEVCDQVTKSANNLEDDELRQSLLSLAKAIKHDAD